LNAAAPVGAVRKALSLSLNILQMQDTSVFMNTLFPVPPHPIFVIHSDMNFFFCCVVAVAI